MSKHQKELIKSLKELIAGGNAHATFEDAIAGLPAELRGKVPAHMPYSIWQLVEHIRITQWDILEFSRDPKHTSPSWPDEYWPKDPEPPSEKAWKDTVKKIKSDQEEFISLLEDPEADLFKPFPHGDGQHLLREALLIGDHTSYHTGEIIVIRRLLGAWK